jgi:hypothetical protein
VQTKLEKQEYNQTTKDARDEQLSDCIIGKLNIENEDETKYCDQN